MTTRGLWLALYAATHDRYPHLAAQCLAARDALPATADALGGPVSPDSADLTPSANPTEIGRHSGDERNET